jgi:hypothetical protein
MKRLPRGDPKQQEERIGMTKKELAFKILPYQANARKLYHPKLRMQT